MECVFDYILRLSHQMVILFFVSSCIRYFPNHSSVYLICDGIYGRMDLLVLHNVMDLWILAKYNSVCSCIPRAVAIYTLYFLDYYGTCMRTDVHYIYVIASECSVA